MPCCPAGLTVTQVTQSVINVSWTIGTGAQTYVTVLESHTGQSKCLTHQTQCLLGCISCGVNYTVALQAISATGLMADCTYQSYSSSEWLLNSSSVVIVNPVTCPSFSSKKMLPFHVARIISSDYFLKCLQFSSWLRASVLQRLLLVAGELMPLVTRCRYPFPEGRTDSTE